MVIRILLTLGILIAIISFAFNPFSNKAGLLIIVLGIVAGFTEGLMLGIPLIIMGALLLLIYILYAHYC